VDGKVEAARWIQNQGYIYLVPADIATLILSITSRRAILWKSIYTTRESIKIPWRSTDAILLVLAIQVNSLFFALMPKIMCHHVYLTRLLLFTVFTTNLPCYFKNILSLNVIRWFVIYLRVKYVDLIFSVKYTGVWYLVVARHVVPTWNDRLEKIIGKNESFNTLPCMATV
jgi:uncharacterized membrane protein